MCDQVKPCRVGYEGAIARAQLGQAPLLRGFTLGSFSPEPESAGIGTVLLPLSTALNSLDRLEWLAAGGTYFEVGRSFEHVDES